MSPDRAHINSSTQPDDTEFTTGKTLTSSYLNNLLVFNKPLVNECFLT